MIPRNAITPVVIALVLATLLTAFFSHMSLDAEFHDAKWIHDPHAPLPYPTAFLGAVYPFVWVLPLLTILFSVALLRRPQSSTVHMSWFVSSVGFALFLWFLLIVISFVSIYSQREHYIRTLGRA